MGVKTYLVGGAAVSLLLAGVWLGRTTARPAGALGFSTGIGPIDFSLQMPQMGLKAEAQVARAMAGSRLDDYRRAENFSAFLAAPTTNVAAYYASAWWLAVASRILNKRTLAAHAQSRLARGSATFTLPGSSQLTGSVAAILTSAAALVREAAGGSKPAEGIARVLSDMATPGSQRVAQQVETDKAWTQEGAIQSGKDLIMVPVKAVEGLAGAFGWVRALFGLLDPAGGSYPWWMRWGSRIAAGGVALIGARWYFAPQYSAAKAAWGATKKAEEPKQIEDKAV